LGHRIYLDSQLGCIFIAYFDRVDAAELDDVRRAIEADAEIRPGLNRLWDERNCIIDVTAADLADLADRWAVNDHLHGERRLAYLINRNVAWGFNRMFEARRSTSDTRVSYELFTDYAEAKVWLGLPADLADPAQLVQGRTPTPARLDKHRYTRLLPASRDSDYFAL